jgi:hypothetical protein
VDLPTSVKGIWGALEVYAKLLEEGLDVYVPVMYIRHDCVVKTMTGKHIDVEIKSRDTDGINFRFGKDFRARSDFFVVMHFFGSNDSWVLPSLEAQELMNAAGTIRMTDSMKKRLRKYHGDYSRLK